MQRLKIGDTVAITSRGFCGDEVITGTVSARATAETPGYDWWVSIPGRIAYPFKRRELKPVTKCPAGEKVAARRKGGILPGHAFTSIYLKPLEA